MTSQYGAYALHAEKASLHARTLMHTPTRPVNHTQARARTHANTDQYVILLFHGSNDSRTCFTITSYEYCLSCLKVFKLLCVLNNTFYKINYKDSKETEAN
jgi:hypothetical protein